MAARQSYYRSSVPWFDSYYLWELAPGQLAPKLVFPAQLSTEDLVAIKGSACWLPWLWTGDAAAGGGDAAGDAAGAVVAGLVSAGTASGQLGGRGLKRERRAWGGVPHRDEEAENGLETSSLPAATGG